MSGSRACPPEPWAMRRGEKIWVPQQVMRHHPLVGFDAVPTTRKPLDNRYGVYPPLSAWLMLAGARFTKYRIVDETGTSLAPSIIELDAPLSAIPDASRVWNWPRKKTRQFILDMAECKLATEELAAALVYKIPNRRTDARAPIAKGTRASVLAKTNGHCTYCGVKLTSQTGQPNSFHTDHLFPVSGGGTDDPALLVPACAACNIKKGAKTFMEFTRESQ